MLYSSGYKIVETCFCAASAAQEVDLLVGGCLYVPNLKKVNTSSSGEQIWAVADHIQLELIRLLSSAMQIVLPPDVEALVQRQLTSGKYKSALEVILAGVQLLEQQEDIYKGRLQELQQEARIGWEASQRGEVVDGTAAMAQIRANLRSRYGTSEL